jgi:hypothetical protein
MTAVQRTAVADLMEALPKHHARMCEYFVRSLREQVQAELQREAPRAGAKPARHQTLALVDEEEVALDVQLSQSIEAIKSVAEYELRELQTFTAALVGDMDMARDHNPFRAETFARALWAASQAMPLSRGLQVSFMRHASTPLAQLLRKTYAASTSRLESMGVEPASYRTLILPAGSRRGRSGESTFAPDLYRMRETMPAPLDMPQESPISYQGQPAVARAARGRCRAEFAPGRPGAPARTLDRSGAPDAAPCRPPGHRTRQSPLRRHADRRACATGRGSADLAPARPGHAPGLARPSLLDKGEHPLWKFVNRLGFAAEMAPDALTRNACSCSRWLRARSTSWPASPSRTPACTAGPSSGWTSSWTSA